MKRSKTVRVQRLVKNKVLERRREIEPSTGVSARSRWCSWASNILNAIRIDLCCNPRRTRNEVSKAVTVQRLVKNKAAGTPHSD